MNLTWMRNLVLTGLGSVFVLSACKKGIKVETFADSMGGGAAAAACPDGATECPFQIVMDARVVNTTSVEFAWTAFPGAVSYSFEVARDAACARRSSLLQFTGYKADIDFLEDGEHFFCLHGVTTDGAKHGAENNGLKVVFDRTAPVVSLETEKQAHAPFSLNPTVTDLTTVDYVWEVISGPGEVSISDMQEPTAIFSMSADGRYVLKLTVTDEADNSTEKEVIVDWDATAPVVNVGPDIITHSFVNVMATVDASAKTLRWEKMSGPTGGTVAFSAPQEVTTKIAADTDGVYVIRLTAIDALGNEGYDELIFTRDTTPPVIDVGPDVTIGNTFTVSPTVTDAVSYQWTKVSGPGSITFSAATSKDTDITASVDGVYVLKLTATDVVGNSSSDTLALHWTTIGPTVSVGADRSVNGAVLIDAISSGVDQWQWSKVSGPGTVAFSAPTMEDTTVSVSMDGTYVLRLTVTNTSTTDTAIDEVEIFVDTVNPTVDVGPDLNVKVPTSVTATTSGTPGVPAQFQWSKIAGPGAITFGTPHADNTSITAAVDGTYVIQLTVTDVAGNTASDTLNFVWDTTAPTVDAGADVTAKIVQVLSGTVTGASTYAWSKVSGPGTLSFGSPNALSTTVVAGSDGAYVIRLTATDAAGNSASDDLTFTWDTVAPTVDAGSNVTTKVMTNITGTAGDATTYSWAQSSGPGTLTFGSAQALTTSVSADTDGTYVVILTAADAAGNSAADAMTFIWDTTAPTVDIGADFTSKGTTNLTPTVDADATTFLWEKISGPGNITFSAANAKNTNVSADTDGVYVLRLTATDAATNSGNDLVTMTWDTVGPVVNVGADVVTKVMHAFTPTVTDDPVGSTYQWTKISGSGTITFGTAAAKNTTASADTDGVYVLRLTVTDPANNSTSDDVNFEWDTTPPTVNVGLDRLVKATATLAASVNGAVSYNWTQQSGPGSITFGSDQAATTTASADTEGTYVLRLTATDAAGNSAFDELNFEWDVTPPSVDAGADVETRVLTTVTGTSSGGTYAWSKLAGPGVISFGSPAALSTTVSASMDGTYILQLSATDAAGNIATDTMTFIWDTTPPSVNVGADRSVAASFSIDAVTSGGSTFAWTKISGPGTVSFTTPTSEDTDVDITGDGTYVLRLTVTDSVGNSAFDDMVVNWDTSSGSGDAPVFTSIDLINAAGDGYLNTAERVLNTNLVGNLTGSHYDAATYAIADASDSALMEQASLKPTRLHCLPMGIIKFV